MNEQAFAFIIPFVLILLVVITVKLMKKQKCNFDERQELMRGKAFKYAFFSILIYGATYTIISATLEKDFMTTAAALIIGMFIGLIVFAVYNIWNEAFFSLDKTPKAYISIMIITTVLSGYNGIISIKNGSITENGMLSIDSVSLACAITFTIILITTLVKMLYNRRAE